MPLIKPAISSRFKPIFHRHAKAAFIAMGGASIGHDLSVEAMTALSAEMFAATFSNMADEFTEELIKVLKEDVLVTHVLVGQIPVTGEIKLT